MFYKFQRLYFFLGRFKIPQPFVNLSDSVEPFSDVLKLTFCSLFHTPESSLNSKVRQRILIPALLLVNSIYTCKSSPFGGSYLLSNKYEAQLMVQLAPSRVNSVVVYVQTSQDGCSDPGRGVEAPVSRVLLFVPLPSSPTQQEQKSCGTHICHYCTYVWR